MRYNETDPLRAKRDALLALSDWTQLPDATISEQQKEAYRLYRQELRDLPQDTNDLNNITWPQEPGDV